MCIWLLFFSTVVDWRCRTGWFYRAGKCYKFLSHATVPWKTAHELCQQNRGHLPVITDTELLVRKSLFFNGSYILTSYLKSYACFYPLQPLYFAIFYLYNISLITINNRNRGFEENEYNRNRSKDEVLMNFVIFSHANKFGLQYKHDKGHWYSNESLILLKVISENVSQETCISWNPFHVFRE